MTDISTKTLKDAINAMDCASQEAFSEISALATMALLLMETEHAYLDPELIARVLLAIRTRAIEAESFINSEAVQVGCDYTDAEPMRRWKARQAAELIERPQAH